MHIQPPFKLLEFLVIKQTKNKEFSQVFAKKIYILYTQYTKTRLHLKQPQQHIDITEVKETPSSQILKTQHKTSHARIQI
jgi:hypothetical protein